MSEKPKTLLYADDVAAVEHRIVAALPEIVDGLIARAREGDVRAAVYLADRILGRVAASAVPPALDKAPPYTEEDFEADEADRRERNELFRTLAPRSGARRGA